MFYIHVTNKHRGDVRITCWVYFGPVTTLFFLKILLTVFHVKKL